MSNDSSDHRAALWDQPTTQAMFIGITTKSYSGANQILFFIPKESRVKITFTVKCHSTILLNLNR